MLDGRIVVTGPRQRNHPDFPLRAFVRCDTCGKPLTGSWSKGRNGHYVYYHCQRQCRAVNVSKAELEGAFADELALLQPTAGYMRLVKDRILHVWEQRRAEARDRTTDQEQGSRRFNRSWTGWTKRSSSRKRSTARATSGSATGYARS